MSPLPRSEPILPSRHCHTAAYNVYTKFEFGFTYFPLSSFVWVIWPSQLSSLNSSVGYDYFECVAIPHTHTHAHTHALNNAFTAVNKTCPAASDLTLNASSTRSFLLRAA